MKRVTLSILALSLGVCVGSAFPGETHTASCYTTGGSATEPIGDRDGHELQVASATCIESGGPFEGLVTTQNTLWEHDAKGSTILSGDGVGRKPGALIAFKHEGGRQPFIQDGKQVGWVTKGKGVFTFATGELARYAGKAFSWVVTSGGPRRVTIQTTVED